MLAPILILGGIAAAVAWYASEALGKSKVEDGLNELPSDEPDPATLEDAAEDAAENGMDETSEVLDGYAVASAILKRLRETASNTHFRDFVLGYYRAGGGPEPHELEYIRERLPVHVSTKLMGYIDFMLKRGIGIEPREIEDLACTAFGFCKPATESGGGGGGGTMFDGYLVATTYDPDDDGYGLDDLPEDFEDFEDLAEENIEELLEQLE